MTGGIYKKIKELQILSLNTKMVNMSSFGDIQEFDNKPTIKYPYVNLDVVNSSINGYVANYTVRVYVCDRNTPYIAYNKCETIINSLLKNPQLDIRNYTINYFMNDFQDEVHGVWADVSFEAILNIECEEHVVDNGDGYILIDDVNYKFILSEKGDLIKID